MRTGAWSRYHDEYPRLMPILGPSIGRPLARSGRVEGTSAALAAELKDAFSRMDGEDNAKMRKECARMQGEFERGLAPGGKAWTAMKAIADL